MVEKEYKKILRSYKTLWQKAKRDRERLLIIKGLIKKINQILNQIKDYDGGKRPQIYTNKRKTQKAQKEDQSQV